MDDTVARALQAARSYYDRSMDLGAVSPNVEDRRGQGRWNAAAIQAINDRYMLRSNPNKPGIDDTAPTRGRGMSPEAIGIDDMFSRTPGANELRMWKAEEGVPIEYIPESERTPLVFLGGTTPSVPFEQKMGSQTPGMAHGGTVEAALHAIRHHLAGGGFLSDLFSGPDYLSTGKVASFANMPTQDETNADFFKADRALRLAREAQASEPARDMPLPLRRPAPEAAPQQQIAAPAPTSSFRRVETLPGDTVEPHEYPTVLERTISPYEFGQAVSGQQVTTQMLPHFQERPGFGQVLLNNKTNWADAQPEVPTSNPQKYTLPEAAFALPAPQAEISRAVSLAQNLAPAQQETIPSAAEALAAVEKLHNAGVYSGEALDKAGEMLGAHLRARDAGIPVEEALRLIRAEGPRMVNQGMPTEERPAVQPLAYTATPAPAPAAAAIDQATTPTTGKLTARVDPNSDAERANNVWNRMLIQESGGRQFDRNGNTITSPVGALGISQVMPSTGPEAAQLAGLPWSLERLRTDPEYNHALGRAYYEAQLERFGDPTLAAAAYNGGPGRVASALRQARETGRPWTAFLRPETQNYVRVVTAQPRAEGGLVDDALHVVREHHADGEAVGPTMQQRLRETIASIDPERSQDQPVMDPAMMGEAWDRARRNYQNFPVQEGEAAARQFVPSVRQEIGAAIAGEGAGRNYGSELRRRAAEFATGSSGLDTGIGALDFVPGTSQVLGATDIAHDIGQGDYAGAAEGAALPVAMTAAQRFAGPLGAAGRRAVEIAKDYAKPATATAAGVAGATVAPDEAEAAIPFLRAMRLNTARNLPKDEKFLTAVRNTPHAVIQDEHLVMPVTRNQKPQQAGEPSVRGGVFYLPEGSSNQRYYTGTGHNFAYGGPESYQGEMAVSNPLFVKGATGGKAPEEAYKYLMGKDALNRMQADVSNSGGYFLPDDLRAELVQRFLDEHAPSLSGMSDYIFKNSSKGNQLRYALQEAAVAEAVRKAGHDAVLGYSTSRTKGPFISELFDVRERSYPKSEQAPDIWPMFLPKEKVE